MPKAEWGVKRTCPNCETRFYDLQRQPILCPECGATYNVDERGKVSGMRERRPAVAVAEDADALVDDESLVDDDADEDADDPLLADDDDEEEPAGPVLSDEENGEGETVPFKDPSLIDDDGIDDDDEDADDEDEIEDLDDVPGKDKDS